MTPIGSYRYHFVGEIVIGIGFKVSKFHARPRLFLSLLLPFALDQDVALSYDSSTTLTARMIMD